MNPNNWKEQQGWDEGLQLRAPILHTEGPSINPLQDHTIGLEKTFRSLKSCWAKKKQWSPVETAELDDLSGSFQLYDSMILNEEKYRKHPEEKD